MEKSTLFWSGQRVMKRWHIYSTELGARIYRGLPAFKMEKGEFPRVPPEEVNDFDADHMTDLVFDPEEVISFEKEHGITPAEDPELEGSQLSPQNARELGLLRSQKDTMDVSIAAAVQVAVFCAEMGRPVIRKEVQDFVNNIDLRITDVSIDKIWRAIPNKYKKGPGRPKKE